MWAIMLWLNDIIFMCFNLLLRGDNYIHVVQYVLVSLCDLIHCGLRIHLCGSICCGIRCPVTVPDVKIYIRHLKRLATVTSVLVQLYLNRLATVTSVLVQLYYVKKIGHCNISTGTTLLC